MTGWWAVGNDSKYSVKKNEMGATVCACLRQVVFSTARRRKEIDVSWPGKHPGSLEGIERVVLAVDDS